MAINVSNVLINAPLEKVWDALTKPELVKLWQFGSVLTTSWEVGSSIEFVAEWQGQVFKQWGQVLAFHPHTSLKYSLFAPRPDLEDKPEHYFFMEYNLSRVQNQTFLKIVQDDNRPNAVQAAPQGEENSVLKALKDVAEGKK